MAVCPHCGHNLASDDAERLLSILRSDGETVYKTDDGRWLVTRGHGEFTLRAVRELIQSGHIVPSSTRTIGLAYRVGKTIDHDASMAAREKFGKHAAIVYVD